MTTTDDEPRTCERCDAPIPPARVKALPGTWLCIECSEEVGSDLISPSATSTGRANIGPLVTNVWNSPFSPHGSTPGGATRTPHAPLLDRAPSTYCSAAVRYTALLLDLDHTLLDSDASERLAFEHALAGAGGAAPGRHLPAFDRINRALWARVERGEISATQLRTARFAQLIADTEIDASPEALADAFAGGLGAHGELYPGVRDVLDALVAEPTVSLALVTNGLSEVQRVRIERLGLGRYFDMIAISSELGMAKPAPAIFEIALAGLGISAKSSALMVGDSLTSDMQGGRNAGIATCWYNPQRRPGSPDGLVDHEITTLDALLAFVRV